MKRTGLVVLALLALVIAPAFCDWRVDLGADAVLGLGGLSGSDITTGGISGLLLPMVEGAYQFEAGPLSLGVGIRAMTVIVATLFWPDVFAEIDVGPLALEGHVGGLAFGVVSIAGNYFETGKVFIPELSGWFKLGKRFRLGAGAVGVYVPDLAIDGVVFLYYIGGKFVLGPS